MGRQSAPIVDQNEAHSVGGQGRADALAVDSGVLLTSVPHPALQIKIARSIALGPELCLVELKPRGNDCRLS
jgi:hypothetical protein